MADDDRAPGFDATKWPDQYVAGKKSELLPGSQAHIKIDFVRQYMTRLQPLMGAARRSPITGEVCLEEIWDIPDFFLVDLLQRPKLPQRMQDLADDPYIFRPVPLSYRTWFYHAFWKRRELRTQQVAGSAKHEHEMLVHSFFLKTVDAPVSAGRHSPIPVFAVGAFLSALAADSYLMLAAIMLFAFTFAVAIITNTPDGYATSRAVSFPIRVAFWLWVIISFKTTTVLVAVGYVSAAIFPVIDFFFGDLAMLSNIKFACRHELIRILPNRVYVCERIGGEFQDHAFGFRGSVPECVAGFRNWTTHHALISDIGGLICELRPLSPEDWFKVSEEWNTSGGRGLPYIGLDTFAMDEDGLIKPSGVVHNIAKDMGDGTWAQPRKGFVAHDLVVDDMEG